MKVCYNFIYEGMYEFRHLSTEDYRFVVGWSARYTMKYGGTKVTGHQIFTQHRFVPTVSAATLPGNSQTAPPPVPTPPATGFLLSTRWGWVGCNKAIYSQTSLIRASLIRMAHNPNTLRTHILYLQRFSNPHGPQSKHISMGTRLFG